MKEALKELFVLIFSFLIANICAAVTLWLGNPFPSVFEIAIFAFVFRLYINDKLK